LTDFDNFSTTIDKISSYWMCVYNFQLNCILMCAYTTVQTIAH